MPKVSVILPNYNHQNFLQERIDSILNQDFTDFELIILDDCSTDNSIKIIENYLDEPKLSHFIRNEANSGSTFKQWRKGIELAQGEYIWIAESDDIAIRTFLTEMVSILERQKYVGISFCSSKWIDQSGKNVHIPEHEDNTEQWFGNSLIENEFLIGNLIYNASSALFRKDLVKNVDFDEVQSFRYTGDWMFWVQAAKGVSVVRSQSKLNAFRRHPNNISTKSDSQGLLFIEGMRIVKYIFRKHNISFFKKRKAMVYWTRKLVQANITNRNGVLQKMPFELKVYNYFLKKFFQK